MSDTPEPERRQQAPALSICPICDGQMELVYSRNQQQVIVCRDCHSGLTIPATAWEVVRIKKATKG